MAKTKQIAEVAVIEPSKFTDLIQKSGIEPTKAEAHVAAFHPSLAQLAELSRPLAGLNKENPTAEDAAIASRSRKDIVKIRTGAEAIKEDRKEIIRSEGNLIQSAYNLVKDACLLTEAEYEEIEKFQIRKEQERKEALAETRRAQLAAFDVDTEYLPLSKMSDEQFAKCLANGELAYKARIAQEKQVEADRVEAERLAAEKAEAERVEREAEEKRIREENERLKLEAQAKADLRKKRDPELRLYVNYIRDYSGTIDLPEDEYQAELKSLHVAFLAQQKYEAEQKEIADKKIAEDNRHFAEMKARADDAAARAEIERAAKEKAESELQAKRDEDVKALEDQKKAANAPDVEKLRKVYADLKAFPLPEMSTDTGKQVIANLKESIDFILQTIADEAKKLK